MHGHWPGARGLIVVFAFLFIVCARGECGSIKRRRDAIRAAVVSKVEGEERESIARVADRKRDDMVGKRTLCLHIIIRWRLAGSKPTVDACDRYALRHF